MTSGNKPGSQLLFSYGTLRQSNVQIAIFGRLLEECPAIVLGYVLEEIEIIDKDVIAKSGKDFHRIMKYTGNPNDEIDGAVFSLSATDLEIADNYEVDDYVRAIVPLKSGAEAWAYIAK